MGQSAADDIVIQADADAIFGVITNLEAYPEWAEGVKAVEVLSTDDEGRPKQASFQVDARVMEIEYTLEYDYDEPTKITWQLVEGHQISQLDGTYDLSTNGDGTHVRYAIEVDVDLPLPRFLKKRAAKHIMETGLRGLKQRVESSS